MDTQIKTLNQSTLTIDCACVIHGNVYDWIYVERLYNMLCRHISHKIRFHVYTEAERPVPDHMIKHVLPSWGIGGAKKSWWYKMQLFDSAEHAGPLLYFDLDTVIIDNIDWICELPLNFFWAVRDFKYLWKPTHYSVNSSIMWWNTQMFDYVWKEFKQQNLTELIKKYRGDQDYISNVIANNSMRFLDSTRIKSWRWECLNGGYNFKKRNYVDKNADTIIAEHTDILVFHGQPKPLDIADPVVVQHWR